jgi:hypothetical protein
MLASNAFWINKNATRDRGSDGRVPNKQRRGVWSGIGYNDAEKRTLKPLDGDHNTARENPHLFLG